MNRPTIFTLTLVLLAGCKKKDSAGTEAGGTSAADSTAKDAAANNVTLPVVGQAVRKGDLILSVVTTAQVRSDGVAML